MTLVQTKNSRLTGVLSEDAPGSDKKSRLTGVLSEDAPGSDKKQSLDGSFVRR